MLLYNLTKMMHNETNCPCLKCIVRFTMFVALSFRDFVTSTGQNVTTRTSFERIFNHAPKNDIPAENNLFLTMLPAEMAFPHVNCSGFKVCNG